MGHPVHSIVRN